MRKILKSGRITIAGLLVMMLSAGSAQAALVNFSLTGYVDGNFGEPFGLTIGPPGTVLTVTGTFDDAAMGVAPYTVFFDQAHSSTNSLTLVGGSLTLDQTQDDNYMSGGSPRLEFDNTGDLIGFNFYWLDSGNSFDSGALAWIAEDASYNFATGYWDANSFTMAPIPVPAAVWLFGSGLLGLVGVARRKNKAG